MKFDIASSAFLTNTLSFCDLLNNLFDSELENAILSKLFLHWCYIHLALGKVFVAKVYNSFIKNSAL